MLNKLLLSFAFVMVVQAAAAPTAEADCGGPFQVPCYTWSWCAYTTPSIFGPVCWGGFVPSTPCAGCNCNRLNSWGLICIPCGSPFEPTCQFGPVCDTDRRYTAAVLCFPCGRTGEAGCLSGATCDPGNRLIFGFCSYSGFSAEPTTNVATMPTLTQAANQPVRGIADIHTHQFSNLGFGGVEMWGAPYDPRGINSALPWCDYTWEFSIKNSFLNIDAPVAPFLGYEAHGPKLLQPVTHLVSNGIPEGSHDVAGTGPFDGWPTYKTYTHQQMYHKWVERAFLGGVRLMVVSMVSNEALCKGSKRRTDFTCNDMNAVDREIQAVKELERAIEGMDGNFNNNSGWYKIAYSPTQARNIIRSGKMAIALGIEVDSLFNCKPGVNCTRAFLRSELQRYYGLGIRHVFPIHQFDNAFGGAAIFRDELNAGNAIVTGSHFGARNCQAEGYDYNVNPSTAVDIFGLLALGVFPASQAYYDQFPADCNNRGLTQAGRELIEEMMDLKFIIDIDHMSRLMTETVLDMARTPTADRPNKYPLISSHTGYLALKDPDHRNEFTLTDDQVLIMKEIGGMVSANNPKGDCETTREFAEAYDHAVSLMKKSPDDQFPAVAFSTDANGFAGNTGPRFGLSAAGCPATSPALSYPFTGIMGGTFNRQVTGDKTFDFNFHGQAHYGLIADFFADLKRVGMTDAQLDPLLNSAESYIRMWEAIDASDQLQPPTVTANITGTEGANGWFISNVTVEWEVEGTPGLVPSTAGCGAVSITQDTPGTTLTCTASYPGTTATSSSVTIRRDATPPVFIGSRLTAANAFGWNNGDVRVHFKAMDVTSGMGSNASVEVRMAQEGAGQVASQDFFDQAGNHVLATLGGINIDKSRPDIGFRFAHLGEAATPVQIAAEQQKWHRHPVTLLVDAQDSLSGVQSYAPSELLFPNDGVNLTKTATATDRASNAVTDTSDPIKIDMTPPAVVITGCPTAPVPFGAAASLNVLVADATSGVVSQTKPNGQANIDSTAEGRHTFAVAAMDHAGNAAGNSCTYDVAYDLGKMQGNGRVIEGGTKVTFYLNVSDSANGVSSTYLLLQVCKYDGVKCAGAPKTFKATAMSSLAFVNDPSFVPSPDPALANIADTVHFSGTGTWLDIPGYAFKVFASDSAGNGDLSPEHHEFSVTVIAPDGSEIVKAKGKVVEGKLEAKKGN